MKNMLSIDAEAVSSVLQKFLHQETVKSGFERVIFGLSGGIDSTVVAYLCARAFQPENVTAVIMPYRTSNPENMQHARNVADILKIRQKTVDISPMVDAFFNSEPDADQNRRGNRMARERMCILYDQSSKDRSLVIGTSNKTELLLGYGTIFGDLASAINPIGDLYKTQIRELAKYLEVPDEIIAKPPSADLWEGQTDEGEIGYSYAEIDRLLFYMIDLRYSEEMLLAEGFPRKMIEEIGHKIQLFQFIPSSYFV